MSDATERDEDRSFDLEHDVAREMERHTPVAAERREEEYDRSFPNVPARLPAVLQPSLWIFLGGLLLVGAWLGFQNPYSAVNQMEPYWPWQLFRGGADRTGDPVFLWDAFRAVALGGAVLALTYIVLSLLPGGRKRSVAVFVAAGAALALFLPHRGEGLEMRTWAIPVVGALLAGAVMARDGRERGSRWLLFALVAALAGLFFFPLAGGATYDAAAFEVAAPFQALAAGEIPMGLDRIFTPAGIHVLGLALLVLLALISLVGLRGAWTLPTAAVLVVLTALGPVLLHLFGASVHPPKDPDLITRLADGHWVVFAASAALLLAGLLSWLGLGGRWTMGVAGAALGVLALVVTARFALQGVAEYAGPQPALGAARAAAIWLGPGFGALLGPLAAALSDR